MNCNEVKDKLPEYLTDLCPENERTEISNHIDTCKQCKWAMEDLEKPIVSQEPFSTALNTSQMLNRVRKSLVIRVIALSTASIVLLISIFFILIPGFLKVVRFSHIQNITRALTDITQFTSPSQIGGYGNSLPTFPYYSLKISAFSSNVTGIKNKPGENIETTFNLITGKFNSPSPVLSNFVHPKIMPSENYLSGSAPSIAKNILIKSGENTVATVDTSLNKTLSLEQIGILAQDLDIKILWLAVECGEENLQPKNLTTGQNQYVQWGLPGKLFLPNNPKASELGNHDIHEYEKSVIDELKWLDKNKGYISPDKNLLRYQGIDNSVGNKAQYIIDNGINVYGLRITGPSKELLKLADKFNIRTEQVVDIDFYYWK